MSAWRVTSLVWGYFRFAMSCDTPGGNVGKTPESIIIRAIREALIRYPEGDGDLDYPLARPPV
jgi:hypothetical protein